VPPLLLQQQPRKTNRRARIYPQLSTGSKDLFVKPYKCSNQSALQRCCLGIVFGSFASGCCESGGGMPAVAVRSRRHRASSIAGESHACGSQLQADCRCSGDGVSRKRTLRTNEHGTASLLLWPAVASGWAEADCLLCVVHAHSIRSGLIGAPRHLQNHILRYFVRSAGAAAMSRSRSHCAVLRLVLVKRRRYRNRGESLRCLIDGGVDGVRIHVLTL
jgi:hypothetical protein